MNLKLLVLSAGFALAGASALAGQPHDTGAVVPDVYNSSKQVLNPQENRCFNGRFLAGVNQSSGNVVYAQSSDKRIFRLSLAEICPSLAVAQKLSLRSGGGDTICTGDRAQLVARTRSGVKRCDIAEVRALNPLEIAALSNARGR